MSRPASAILCMSDFLRLGNTLRITSNQKELNLRTWASLNGWDGSSAVTIEVATGVYIWSDNTAVAALTINGSWPGGITLINNGFIMGRGGNARDLGGNRFAQTVPPQVINGGNAISLGVNCSIQNNSYIAGGGGGGGKNGGGGAGGGNASTISTATVGLGGAVGQPGSNGGVITGGLGADADGGSGGGGGRILPGNGGPSVSATVGLIFGGRGGGAGGGGGATYGFYNVTNGQNYYRIRTGGGGGGWGAAGGAGYGLIIFAAYPEAVGGAGGSANNGSDGTDVVTAYSTLGPGSYQVGGLGGKAIALNGYSVTWLATGFRYGAIS